MIRVQTPGAEFARRGFADPDGAARIWAGFASDGGPAPLELDRFADLGDRLRALQTLDRIRDASPARFAALCADRRWCDAVLRVAGASSVLAGALAGDGALVDHLGVAVEPRDHAGWEAFFAERVPVEDGEAHVDADALRLANRAAIAEIAARDLAAPEPEGVVEEVVAELTHVADHVLRASLALARAEVPDWRDVRLAVIAFGKAGAGELNYLSDVDVMYLAEPADGVSVERAVTVATRLAAAQARICSAHTRAGTIWSIDAGLRPEGHAGPLVRTLASYRAYYGQWAKNWEFQALLKARPAAGDPELGARFVAMVEPMVWAAGGRDGFVPEMRAMRERVISLIPAGERERDIKLAAGGLRDTEFSVQLLQLVHGRGDDRIRSRGTLDALAELTANGYIGRGDGAQLAEHYRFQRALEHRVQLQHLRRTHLVPESRDQLAAIARTLRRSVEDLDERWHSSLRDVRRLRQRIFFSPILDVVTH
ncbi:MAG: bifunctional glutamine-synthetase adenylyltransferase/deadenyltransferase, partial [Propionibacterium sp.]|nr:bifunctional glutamine-synthetase adenylyltransferase/deadenyltransferase [Propionibacterium sp.]